MKLGDYPELWRVSHRRSRSEQDYLEFQTYQARQLISYLESKHVTLPGQRLLDLGSGIGGYSREFARRGAEVVSIDLMQPHYALRQRLTQMRGDASLIPLRDESTNIVFCASLIEHVAQPEAVLHEIERVLITGGAAYVSFPPYYNPTGGHEFAPFHYLGEKIAIRLVKRQRVVPDWVKQLYSASENPASFADLYRGWGLYKMTIGKMRRLIAQTGLACKDMSTRYLPISFIRWPVLGEFLTWHAQFLLVKELPCRSVASA